MIETFTADAVAGGARLAWSVRGAETVTLSGHGRVPAEQDAFAVTLTATATFVLVAYGSEFGAIESCARTVEVERAGEGVPLGSICLWAGTRADIPRGWALCDGRNGRPDLRGRFAMGATAEDPPGKTGEGDPHTHTLKVRFAGRTAAVADHAHALAWTPARSDARLISWVLRNRFTGITHDAHHADLEPGGAHAHPIDVEVEWKTDPAAVARPLGHALCFIIRSADGDHAAG